MESRLEKKRLASAQRFQFGKEAEQSSQLGPDLLFGSGLLSLLESELVCSFWFGWKVELKEELDCVWVLERVC